MNEIKKKKKLFLNLFLFRFSDSITIIIIIMMMIVLIDCSKKKKFSFDVFSLVLLSLLFEWKNFHIINYKKGGDEKKTMNDNK